MMGTLLMLIPPEAYVLLIVISGVLIMVGLKTVGLGILGFVFLACIFGPLIEGLMDMLPNWAFLLLLVFLFLSLLKMVLGRGVFDHLVGSLLFTVLMVPFRMVGFVLRSFFFRRRI